MAGLAPAGDFRPKRRPTASVQSLACNIAATKETFMALSVSIDLGYAFEVKAKFAEVFKVLSDVPQSASHFPKVEKLTDMGSGVYQWEMKKVGTAQANIQTVYTSKYSCDATKGTVVWKPVPGIGNAQVSGSWYSRTTKIPSRWFSRSTAWSRSHCLA